MNIFVLDSDPIKAAQFHCDKHLKMILETGQMLSTCIRHLGINDDILYKKFNPKHPCNVWLMESRENVKWLLAMGRQLGRENAMRTGKEHKSMTVVNHAEQYLSAFPDVPMTKHKLAMPMEFMSEDVVHSYRLYYAGAKFRFSKWKTCEPYWWSGYRTLVQRNGLEVVNDKDDGVK
jgi:hypothetical protein